MDVLICSRVQLAALLQSSPHWATRAVFRLYPQDVGGRLQTFENFNPLDAAVWLTSALSNHGVSRNCGCTPRAAQAEAAREQVTSCAPP